MNFVVLLKEAWHCGGFQGMLRGGPKKVGISIATGEQSSAVGLFLSKHVSAHEVVKLIFFPKCGPVRFPSNNWITQE